MKIAYFSPLNPQRSGISDYSEELLPHLAEHAELELFLDGFRPSNPELMARFRVHDYGRDPSALALLDRYDAVVYHLGNDHRYHAGMLEAMRRRAGIVVFHDFALQDFFLGLARERRDLRIYLDEVGYCHGEAARTRAAKALDRGALPEIVTRPLEFPLNKRIAEAAEGIIVHSEWAAERFAKAVPFVPVARIKHHITESAAMTARSELRRSHSQLRIASFGLITPDKGIERALRALSSLRQELDFRYTLVGSDRNFPELRELIGRYELEDRVSITGYVSLDEFQKQMLDCDLAICLRERSVGATSGSLCRLMAAGIPAVISDVAAFSEFPNSCVVKVDHDEFADSLLAAYLRRFMEDPDLCARLGANARAHMLAEHRIQISASRYLDFCRQVAGHRSRREMLNQVTDEILCLGVRPDDPLVQSVATEVTALTPAVLSVSPNGRLAAPNDNVQSANAVENSNAEIRPTLVNDGVNADAHETLGRLGRVEGIDYRRGALEYARQLSDELSYYLHTKPFCNLHKPIRYSGDGMDPETHRHFCDFANMAATLALRADARILDVGCGPGWLSEFFARLGYDVTGMDVSEDLIQIARERLERLPYQVDHETPVKCRFLVHDIEHKPLAKKFDALICYDALHHFEDERSVFRNLADMLDIGGVLFIVEGDKPEDGSATAEELRRSMREYKILESPFSAEYLRALANEHGFAIVGDYVNVTGLFERESISRNQMSLNVVDTNYHYLVCKKVTNHGPASTVPTSRVPGDLRAQITRTGAEIGRLSSGQAFELSVAIKNVGDTLWLVAPEPREGIVMPAVRILDDTGDLVDEFHGQPGLPHAMAPGESVALKIKHSAPHRTGSYVLKLDLVDEHVCWFEEKGSEPLLVRFEVV